jgi:hypothetical protein
MSLRNALALALAVFLPTLLSGCLNDCQLLCNEMAEYWDECPNISFGDSQASDCRDAFKDDELLEKYEPACAALMRNAEDDNGNTVTALRADYTCEDMEDGPGGAFGGE